MGTIGIVLLIACANVANLMLVRSDDRRHEFAVRTALGAGRWPIARGLLVEGLVLALTGGALGVALAYVGLKILLATAPATLPRLEEISLDPRVVAFAIAPVVRVKSAVRPDPRLRANHAARVADWQRGAWRKREPRAAADTQRARGRAGGVGARAAHQLGSDDPNVPGAQQRRARVCRSRNAPDGQDLGPAAASRRAGEVHPDAARDSRQDRGAPRCARGRVRQFGADGSEPGTNGSDLG